MDELTSEVEDRTTDVGGIPTIWDRGKQGDELRDHHQFLSNGMNYWNEMRKILKLMFRENKEGMTNFDKNDYPSYLAYKLGYERALQDVHKILPKTKGVRK